MNRAWAYIISKPLNEEDQEQLNEMGKVFVKSWTAHDLQLSAEFKIYKKRILLVTVNEQVHNASGCSIDKLVRFIKEAESRFKIELLNRLLVAYKQGETLEIIHSSKIKDLLEQNILNEDSIILNTAVGTEQELLNWEQPLKETWLSKYLTKA